MITIYYYCLDLMPDDERFVADALTELAEHLKEDPIKLPIGIRHLEDDPKLANEVGGIISTLDDSSDTFTTRSGKIAYLLSKSDLVTDTRAKLLVYCSPDSYIANAARREKPSACWGATCGLFSAVYKPDNKFIIWHEVVHLLLSREDDEDECYEPYHPYPKKGDCDCESCLMQYAPAEKTVGEWPSLCSKVTRMLQKLVKKDLYFIGFLVNVDDSILKLQIGDGFSIDKKERQEIMPFLQKLDFHYGAESGSEILNFNPNGRASGSYCINKHFPEFVESTPQGGIVIPIAELKRIYQSLRDKLRLLRLFKGGNVFLRYSLFYYLRESIPQVAQVGREYPLTDRTVFQLNDDEYAQAEAFINDTKIPFQDSFLQLAFDSFELSYETYNRGLAFLSLMISVETLFGEQSELKYRISRNVAVLLGRTEYESQEIFKDLKDLYKKRSKLVHGDADGDEIVREEAQRLRFYVRESIKSIYRLGLGREELLRILTKSGFGQSPLPK